MCYSQERWLEARAEYMNVPEVAGQGSEDGRMPREGQVTGHQQSGLPTASATFELGIKRDYKVYPKAADHHCLANAAVIRCPSKGFSRI